MPIVSPSAKTFHCQQCNVKVAAHQGWFPIGWMRAVGTTYLRVKPENDRAEPDKVEFHSRATESVYYCPTCQKNHGLVLTLSRL